MKIATFMERVPPGALISDLPFLLSFLTETLRGVQIRVPKSHFRKCVWTVKTQYLPPFTPLKVQTVVEFVIIIDFKQPLQCFRHFMFYPFSFPFFPKKRLTKNAERVANFTLGTPPSRLRF